MVQPTVLRTLCGIAARGVNNRGNIIVGECGKDYAVYWIDGSTNKIGPVVGGSETTALAVNGDGGVVVGFDYILVDILPVSRAFRWKKDATPPIHNLNIPEDYSSNISRDLNNTGDIIVGYGTCAGGNTVALRWKETSGGLEIVKLISPLELIISLLRVRAKMVELSWALP